MFKQHKSKIKHSTDRCHLWTEPLPELAASSSLWSLFDCLRISIRSQALQISVVAIRWKPDSACLVFESSSWWVTCTKTIGGQQALQSKETKEAHESKADFTPSRKAHFLWSYYNCVALLELYLHLLARVFAAGTMVDRSCLFSVQTAHCVQLWPTPVYSCSPATLSDGNFNQLLPVKSQTRHSVVVEYFANCCWSAGILTMAQPCLEFTETGPKLGGQLNFFLLKFNSYWTSLRLRPVSSSRNVSQWWFLSSMFALLFKCTS